MHGVLIKLAKYNQVMNSAVYAAAEQLPDELRKKDLGAFFKSIHGTLNHLLWADKNWLRRFVLAGLGCGRLTEGLSEEHLGQTLQYRNVKGEEMQRAVKEVLAHLFNHQTHHRGQITTLLTQQGIDTGITDFIYYAGKF